MVYFLSPYEIGEVFFLDCRIRVDARALFPRPETEILADHVARCIHSGVLWDLCTGSGCLGISLKKRHPSLQVSLSDISMDALALAKENAEANGVEVEILCGDLLAPFSSPFSSQGQKADAIVCNPPYIAAWEYPLLDPSVRDFEPRLALVAGERGTEFYERLAEVAPLHLHPGGKLFLEIGASQGAAVQEIFRSGPWKKRELLRDWAGKDRFFFLEKQDLSRVS